MLQVACGGAHTLILLEGGGMMGMGANDKGQLGTGDCQDSMFPSLLQYLVRKNQREPYLVWLILPRVWLKLTRRRIEFERYFGV